MKSSLRDVLCTYPSPANAFAFVCSTEERCRKLRDEIADYYDMRRITVCRGDGFTFDNLTVLENIFVKKAHFSAKKRREQVRKCRELLDLFKLDIDPHVRCRDLANEEKHIVELLRILMLKPEVLLLSKTSSHVGHYYFDIYCELLGWFKQNGTAVVLVTPRWEDTIRICEKVAVTAGNSNLFTVIAVDSIKSDPHQLIYAMSDHEDETSLQRSRGNLLSSIHALFQYSDLIAQSKSLEESLAQFTAKVCDDLNALSCIIYIRDDTERILRYCDRAIQNQNHEMDPHFINKLIDANPGTLFVAKNEDDMAGLFLYEPSQAGSVVCYPITIAPRRMGLLQLTFRDAFFYTDEQFTAIKILCTEIARMVLSVQLANNVTLIQESNHRIKNNLQTIIGIIYMQKRSMRNNLPEGERDGIGPVFDSIIARIQIISKVHEYLSAHSTDCRISLNSLIGAIVRMYDIPEITIQTHVEEINLDDERALYLAMILNELISNCYKHAFEKDFVGASVSLYCLADGDVIQVEVIDNGKGLSRHTNPEDTTSVGLSIVQRILAQMNGEIEFSTGRGTQVTVRIPAVA